MFNLLVYSYLVDSTSHLDNLHAFPLNPAWYSWTGGVLQFFGYRWRKKPTK